MISGVVKPARMDLGNEQLVRNHVHAMWLAQAGFPLGRSIDEVLDLDEPMAPLVSEIAQQTHLSGMELAKCRSAIASIVAAEPAITRQRWFTESWIDQTLAETPEAFDRAFDRWRELYRAAHLHRDQARRIQDRLRVSNDERRAAEQLERAAKRELDQLTNKGTYDDGDFYPYRYLAAEGFLSGFNFPLLPLRLFVSGPRTDDVMTRPRFLGLREYGPNNVVYHEGRTFRVIEQSVPPDGLEGRLLNASICRACGYLHRSISTAERSDRCLGCNAELTGSANDELHDLLEQGAGRAVMSTRINSGEEERLREGYRITTHFAFAPGIVPQQYDVITPGNTSLFTFTIAPQTELWQINRGWRSRGGHEGFKLDMHTGRWSSRDEEHGDEQEVDAAEHSPTHRVFPFVRDTRNVVLFDFGTYEKSADADTFRITFANVLIRGLEIANQLEEGELAGEFIGDGDQLRFLCWETVEGGTGAWERLETEPVMIQAVARAALDLCHMASDGADHPDRHPCGGACYACLMSYRNQREHMYLDRSVIRPTLAALSTAVVVPRHEERTFEGQRDFLYERTDPASTLEREFLDYLVKYRCNLPSAAQNRPDPAIYAQPDFFYEQVGTRGACIFVDGASHSSERAQLRDAAVRDRLYEAGFQVISVRAGAFAEAIAAHPAIFGQRPD